MAWKSIDEYVRFMVPRIGYAATADAMRMPTSELRKRWPGLMSKSSDFTTCELSGSNDAVRQRANRRRNITIDFCKRCGGAYERHSNNCMYCPSCRVTVRREQKAQWIQDKRSQAGRDGEVD